jgi:hypothetical protein
MGVATSTAKVHTGTHFMPVNGGIYIINAIKCQPCSANGWPKRNALVPNERSKREPCDPAGKLEVTDSLAPSTLVCETERSSAMESTDSIPEGYTPHITSSTNWKQWARAAGVNVFKGACTALGAGAVSLLIWWLERK